MTKNKKRSNFLNKCKEVYGEHYNEFDFGEVVISSHIDCPIKIFCKACNRSFWCRTIDFLSGSGCPHCNRELKALKASIPFSEFKNKGIELYENRYDYSLAKEKYYRYSEGLIPIKCNKCGTIFYQTPYQHLNCKTPCPNCRHEILSKQFSLSEIEIKERLEMLCGPDYDFSNSKIIDRFTEISFINKLTGKQITQKPVNILNGGAIDPDDNLSIGEKLAKSWLDLNSINFKSQVIIKDKIEGRNKKLVIIDFIVYKNNREIFIEINGIQHYDESHFIGLNNHSRSSTKYEFSQELKRDKNIRKYCKENNIMFIEIPYTYFSYKKIDDILTRTILNGESPDFIKIPEITYIEPNNKPENYDNV